MVFNKLKTPVYLHTVCYGVQQTKIKTPVYLHTPCYGVQHEVISSSCVDFKYTLRYLKSKNKSLKSKTP